MAWGRPGWAFINQKGKKYQKKGIILENLIPKNTTKLAKPKLRIKGTELMHL